jgi:ABC-2 type transport system ATP-binding protein
MTQGTVHEVVERAHLTTWEVTGPNLMHLADELRKSEGVQQANAFGNALHVSSDDAAALERAIAPYQKPPYAWKRAESSLEDVFIHLMARLEDNARA